MSEAKAVRCDRCGVEALLIWKNGTSTRPDGWGALRYSRAVPFVSSSTEDMCSECFDKILRAVKETVST